MEKLLNDYLARVERYLKPPVRLRPGGHCQGDQERDAGTAGGGSGPGADCGAAWGRQDPGPAYLVTTWPRPTAGAG